MNKKPTILLCWGYNRKNWIENFEALNNDFNFIYLFYMHASEEQEVFTKNKRIYYTDFRSAKQLLTHIAPAKVVFMGLDSLLTIAINVQCRKSGIPTYFMSHGSASLSLDDYREFKLKKRNLFKETLTHKLSSWLFIFKFLMRALGIRNISSLPLLLRYQFQTVKMHSLLAMAKNKTSLRIPSKFIVFSKEEVDFQIQIDECDVSDFFVLGNLEITAAIKMAKEEGINNKGFLLYIETPLSVIEEFDIAINKLSIEENNAILAAMNEYAMNRELKLFVKLHPYSYKNSFFIQHPNIIYHTNNKKESLILNSDAIIFYNSSLAIPSLYFKPCCMFTIGRLDEFQAAVAETGICTVIDYKTMINDPSGISFITPAPEAKQLFIDKYIGPAVDGKSLERLRDILLY